MSVTTVARPLCVRLPISGLSVLPEKCLGYGGRCGFYGFLLKGKKYKKGYRS